MKIWCSNGTDPRPWTSGIFYHSMTMCKYTKVMATLKNVTITIIFFPSFISGNGSTMHDPQNDKNLVKSPESSANIKTEVGSSVKQPIVDQQNGSSHVFLCPANMTEVQKERQKLVNSVCTPKYEDLPSSKYRDIYVDDARKTIYCSIPKAGNTNWRALMIYSTQRFQDEYPNTSYANRPFIIYNTIKQKYYGLNSLSNYSRKKIQYRLKNYYKFIFSRHPMLRLLSAYRNKFFNKKTNAFTDFFGFAPEIAELYHQKSNENYTKEQVNFHEFVEWVTKEGDERNHHWSHLETLCLTCNIQYDFIGSFEKLNKEYHCVMPHLNNDSRIQFPQSSELGPSSLTLDPTNPNSKKSTVKNYFQNVSMPLLKSVAQHYKRDCDMFGYDCLKLY